MGTHRQTTGPAPEVAGAAAYDEACHADGGVREHWRYLLDSLEKLGAEEFQRRRDTLERLLRDDGATYNDYSAGLVARPWTLDPIPLLIDSREWAHIESGIRERAELLDLVLRDLYGQRSLLQHGIIPPELIFSHPGFLRQCQGISLPGEQLLIQYAADMVRAPGGDIRVLSDRAGTPSGSAYALENRLAMSRVFPSLFRDSQVHRLSLYFNSLRRKLDELNPNGGIGRVAVLTPGAYNETYFEHSFLAAFLGYELVQGSDLTVRDGYVWLKTLDGLSRIDVLLRRIDDEYCDPVELKSDSRLGVPGLLEVMRLGNVAVANPPGAGLLENRGLARYLPAVARHLLGRDLRLDCAATFWCGDPGDRAYVLDKLPQLVIKHTCRSPADGIRYGALLSTGELETLRGAILAEPMRYVAQEYLQPSHSPVWIAGERSELPLILRSFAVAGESSYTVMPGGLTRVGAQPGMFEISNRLGSLSKDTWVLASEPERQVATRAAPRGEPAGAATGAELPSRVVENLFWTGRYTERAESTLRLLRTVFNKLRGEEPVPPQSRTLLLQTVTRLTTTYPGFLDDAVLDGAPDAELLSVVLDAERTGSAMFTLHALLRAVSQVKDYMSADTQRILNDLGDAITTLPGRLRSGYVAAPGEELGALITHLLALAGLTEESMVRGQGWTFLDMGRRIERALQTLTLLRSLWVPAPDAGQASVALEAALLTTETLMHYRRRYQGELTLGNGLDLMLLEPGHPRTLGYQFARLAEHLAALPPGGDGRLQREQRSLLEASSSLQLADVQALTAVTGTSGQRAALERLLARAQDLLRDTADLLGDRYFDHTAGPQPMTPRDAGRAP